jgi:protein involved in polysaccharide export with SLBB domain
MSKIRFFSLLTIGISVAFLHGKSLAQASPPGMDAASMGGGFAGSLGGVLPGGMSTGSPGQLKGGLPTTTLPAMASRPEAAGQERALPPLQETRFQQFVEDSSGKKLSLYGYNLFESSRFPSLTDVPVPANYVVGPGDEVDLKVWGMAELSVRLPIDRNGQIVIPRVGPVTVAGTRADQLEAQLKSQVGKVFTNFELSATIGKLRAVQVFVVGQARRPGAYMVSSLSTLISALFESGGPAATGSLRNIQLTRGGKLVTTLDLYAFIHRGDTSKDARLLPGDVIVIPPAGPRVALLGETDSPAVFELLQSQAQPQPQARSQAETIAQLLAYSGGQRALVLGHRAQLERVDASRVKGPRTIEAVSLDERGIATPLKDGDILTLLKVSPEFANAVTLRGNVAYPLRHIFKAGMRVSDLIPEPSALVQPDYFLQKNKLVQFELGKKTAPSVISSERVLTSPPRDEINWDYATVERTDPDKLTTSLIPFNLAKAVRGRDAAHDLELKLGDVVTVYSVKELPPPLEKRSRFVRVSGEVSAPGFYQLKGQETLTDLIEIAGGLSKNAYLYGTVLTRESARAQQQENLNRAIKRLEADIEAKSSALIQNAQAGEKASQEGLAAQQASQNQVLNRLASLKSSGRVALEMNPEQPRLPFLTLEDADEVYIPPAPSFVGVFGAVLLESSLMHRPGASVKDYIDKAGLGREAELDDVIIIRADGSAEATPRGLVRKNLWGASVLSKKLMPGDSVLVPEALDKKTPYTAFIQGAKDWTQLIYQMGLGVVAIKTLRQ